MRRRIFVSALTGILTLTAAIALAGVATPVAEPDSDYLASTERIDLSDLAEGGEVSHVTGETLSIAFSDPFEKRTVPSSWCSWSSPPEAESATPHVLWSGLQEHGVTLTLSDPVTAFGVEIMANSFGEQRYVVDFRSGGESVATVVRWLDTSCSPGEGGSRLFAVAVADGTIDEVVVDAGTSDGFSIAQLRYAPVSHGIEVGLDLKPGSDRPVSLGNGNGVTPAVVLGGPGFDVTTIDPSTLEIGGVGPAHDVLRRDGTWKRLHDVNGDGHLDVVVHVRLADADLSAAATEICVTGQTVDGDSFRGCDSTSGR